jgi:regulator of replication initiation timing
MATPRNRAVSETTEALDDMIRLLDLQDQVKELYGEIGRIKRRLKSTATNRQERRAELQRLRDNAAAHDRALLDRADAHSLYS